MGLNGPHSRASGKSLALGLPWCRHRTTASDSLGHWARWPVSPEEQHQSRGPRKRLRLTCEDKQVEVGGSKVLSTRERGRGPSAEVLEGAALNRLGEGDEAQSRARRA